MARFRLTRRSLIGSAAASVVLRPSPSRTRAVASPHSTDFPAEAATTAAYRLDVRLETETRILAGTESIAWRNTTGRDQDTLFLRLYPNAAYYGDGETALSRITVDGRAAQSPAGDDPTVAAIPLGRTVQPGAMARIDLAFETRVPLGASGSFGIFGVDADRGSWALADWYPILAGWEPERQAWYLDAP
ncbi:MAG: hypothetical protein ACTHMX_15140, partial [Thermomicrobiales bacterium]